MSAPLVSVLTPSFGQARWLRDNLRSVEAQTYPRIEQIVMDGGSSDGSIDVLGASRARWRSEPDRGQSHAVNKALRESQGEIIGWLNADDAYFTPGVVLRVVEEFARRPECDVVYGHAALVDWAGRVLHAVWVPRFSFRTLAVHNFIIQPAAFIRRRVIEDALLDERYDMCMDRELWLRLGACHRFRRVDAVLAADRHHAARKTVTNAARARAESAELDERYGVRRDRATLAKERALKAAYRLRGLSLVPSIARAPLAFDGSRDAPGALALRQATMTRAAMLRNAGEPRRAA